MILNPFLPIRLQPQLTLRDTNFKEHYLGACHITVATCALVICLTYPDSPSGTACPRASRVYIRQITRTHVTTITYIFQYSYTYVARHLWFADIYIYMHDAPKACSA